MLFYKVWLTPILTIADHTEDLTKSNVDIPSHVFRFVYKTKNYNNISLVVFLKIHFEICFYFLYMQ